MLTRLRVKTRVRIFHLKKTQDIMAPYKGRTFWGQCPVNTVIHRPVLEKAADFLSSCTPISFSRKRLLCGVYLAIVKNTLKFYLFAQKLCATFQQQQQHDIK
jgi:hypothetical protein